MTTIHPAPQTEEGFGRLAWGNTGELVTLDWGDEHPVSVTGYQVGGRPFGVHRVPLVEIITTDHGHAPASSRLAHTTLGAALRYVKHEELQGERPTLVIHQEGEDVRVRTRIEMITDLPAVRVTSEVENIADEPLELLSVTSWSAGFTSPDADDSLAGWVLRAGRSDWLGEGRWSAIPLRSELFPRLRSDLTGHNPRGAVRATSQGTWSTADHLPTALLLGEGIAIGFDIEHNGAWRWEVGEDIRGAYFALSGPTEVDAGWSRVLQPGQTFLTVPVAIIVAADESSVTAALTDYRRALRRPHPDNELMPVVFNDYMNTLNGDPSTEKLLPLIRAAAEVGAEVFCIDAGWYDDSGHWWDSVGEWRPSTTRFPGGLSEVIKAIRDAGMVPGLWLEPEVIGVRSPMAHRLPASAFLQRHGRRVVEHDRYHLDLRHPTARAHLDGVIDRLVAEFGIGFLKLDYNINPGPGTDLDADSVGDGLLEHNRAHLAWLDGVLDRHPGLIIENCSSGAMRMDFALLSRLAMQSTSDQQDFLSYPPIAASAPLSMVPEQAASWAYPQPDMSDEEIAFCLVTGLLGRFYLSGYLNRMTPAQRTRVADAVQIAKTLRHEIRRSHPHWPLGLPAWNDEWVALGLHDTDTHSSLISLWHRGGSQREITLSLPQFQGHDVSVHTVFSEDLPAWLSTWDAAAGSLSVRAHDDNVAARTLRLVTTHPSQDKVSHQ